MNTSSLFLEWKRELCEKAGGEVGGACIHHLTCLTFIQCAQSVKLNLGKTVYCHLGLISVDIFFAVEPYFLCYR